jgi:hypothetical protein
MRRHRWTLICGCFCALFLACSSEKQQDDSDVVAAEIAAPDQTGQPGDIAPLDAELMVAGDEVVGCQPQCEDKDCGPDGCGGNCGECGGLQVCWDGICCSPDCDDFDCGPDGCGGSCGYCSDPAVCLDGLCCSPACDGRECGPDNCGSNCGQCGAGEFCHDGICSAPDQDYDGVPDAVDLYPQDPDFPGVAAASTVYAHTADTLYAMDVKLYKLEKIGDFQWPDDGATHKMTDIGIDSYGVLYGTSYEYLYVCHPQTAECRLVAKLPSAFNGLTMVPAPLIDPQVDVLVGVSEEGGWYRLDVAEGELTATKLGGYGSAYASAGDAYSITGVGTFAAVHKDGADDNFLVSVNPATGHVEADIGPITGYEGIFGLAGWTDKAFAFDKTGDVVLINTNTAEVKVLHETEISWWGAGVKAKIDP